MQDDWMSKTGEIRLKKKEILSEKLIWYAKYLNIGFPFGKCVHYDDIRNPIIWAKQLYNNKTKNHLKKYLFA